MTTQDLRAKLVAAGAILEGDYFFALNGGEVTTTYVDPRDALPEVSLVNDLARQLIDPFEKECTVIASPKGAQVIAYTAGIQVQRRFAQKKMEVVWAERQVHGFVFERPSFTKRVKGRRVVIIDDTLTTGRTLKEVIKCVHEADGEIIAVSVIWNRGGIQAKDLGVPILYELIDETLPSWVPEEHEMWGEWPLVINKGHPEYFPDYPGPSIVL